MLDGHQINPNLRHQLGWTALMVAAVNGKSDVCKTLIQAGADPNLDDKYINSNRSAKQHGLHSLEGKITVLFSRTCLYHFCYNEVLPIIT